MKVDKELILRTFLLCLIFIFISVTVGKERPKIALVLSGGGAKGIAHIGTLKMLDSLDIPIDYIVGTSMGGIVGALYAVGYSGDSLEVLAKQTDWQEVLSDEPLRADLPFFEKRETGRYQLKFGLKGLRPRPSTGVIAGQKIYLLFSDLSGYVFFIHGGF
ncbi:MAG: patatin-like phospholipase family protein [candidate division KSB1 bacterium]|nr:patatin-like phospholipase family protein [candidate division KSB1 bacterium]